MSAPTMGPPGLLTLLMALGSTGAARALDTGVFGDLMRRIATYTLLLILFVAGLVTVLVDLFQMTRMDGALSASILGTVGAAMMAVSLAVGMVMRVKERGVEPQPRSPLIDALTLFLLDVLEEKKAEMAQTRQDRIEAGEKL